jgi:hypothetical protein
MQGWRQSVKPEKGKTSLELNVTVGIPQGGPLSAKLFTYDTDDINYISIGIDQKRVILKNIQMIREFCNIYQRIHLRNVTMNMNCSLSNFVKCLLLDPSKCEEIILSHKIKNKKLEVILNKNLTLNETEIPKVTTIK